METPEIYPFFGYYTPLCNTRYSPFEVDGIEYNSLEKFICARKARYFKDENAFEKIMLAEKPMDARWVKIKGFDGEKWGKVAEKELWIGLQAKFKQNDGCRKYLLKTSSPLAYCDEKDRVLGTGVNRFSPAAKDPESWTGANLLGNLLVKLREELRQEAEQKKDDNPPPKRQRSTESSTPQEPPKKKKKSVRRKLIDSDEEEEEAA